MAELRAEAPVVFGNFLSTMSLRSGSPTFGTPEPAIGSMVVGQLAQEYRFLHRDGHTIWVRDEMRLSQEAGEGEIEIVGAWTDVTSRKRSDLALATQRQVLEMVASGAELADTLDTLIRNVEGLLPDVRASVLLLDPDGRHLRHGAGPSLPDGYNRAVDGIPIGEAVGSCGTAAFRAQPVIVEDIASDPLWANFTGLALQYGLKACWSTPIRGPGGHIVGTFAVYHGYPHEPSDRERRLVDRFTDIASVAIEHSRLIDEVVESEELFRRSFEDNPAGEVLCDLNRRVERANAAFCALSGYPAEKLIGTSIGSVLCLSADTEARIQLMLTAGGACVTRQSVVITADGSECPVEATVSVIRDRNGSPARLAFNVLDLTERLAAEAHRQAHREADVARQIAEDLRASGARVSVEERSESVGKKIRAAELGRFPFMLVVGDREMEAGEVSVRSHEDGELGSMSVEKFCMLLDS